MKTMRKWIFNMTLAALALPLLICGCAKKEEPVQTILVINSVPDKAAVILSKTNKEIGKTPFQIPVRDPGNYLFEVRAAGYESAWLNLNLEKGSRTERTVTLKPLTGKVMIVTEPAGARVTIKGELKGVTPLILQDLPLGTYEAMLDKSGFEPKPVSWKVAGPRPVEVAVPMASNIGVLVVKSEPSRAAVYINDKLVGHTEYRTNLEEGAYNLKISSPGYAEINRNVIVTKNTEHEENIPMVELAGSLEVISKPDKAEVKIDDKTQGLTPLKIDSIKAGNYTVTISKDGYDTVTREVEIARGGKQLVELDMTRNTSGIDLVVNPPGVTVYMNGKVIGVTEKGESEYLSKTISLRDLNAGEYTLIFAHKRARPDRITQKVVLKKGEITRVAAVTMWVANAELKIKGSRSEMVQINSEDAAYIYYSPEQGVRVRLERSKIEYIKKLEDSGDDAQ